MVKFFILGTTEENIEQTYKSIKDFAKTTLGWGCSDRRIFSIKFRHDRHEYKAEVGRITKFNHEEVVAILESQAYLVCTPTRGVLRGEPILVGENSIIEIMDFD